MNRKPTLGDVDDSLGILSSLFTISTTIAGLDAIAGGTFGVEEFKSPLAAIQHSFISEHH